MEETARGHRKGRRDDFWDAKEQRFELAAPQSVKCLSAERWSSVGGVCVKLASLKLEERLE